MNLPKTMRAVDIREPGGPEVLELVERPLPEPRPGEVLIAVEAAGVNRPDCIQRMGRYPVPEGADPLPGLEVAGEIVALGTGVSRYEKGDKVTALVPGGGYAEYCRVPAYHCLPWPRGYDAVKAAALPETVFTVYYNLVMRNGLESGQQLLVHGGSSGIGTIAIQLARVWGAVPYTTAGSAEKCGFCEKLGAEKAFNYREEDWEEGVKEATGGRGVDLVLDMVAGDYVQRNLNVLAEDGRYSLIAVLKGPKAEVDLRRLLFARLTLSGSTLRPLTDELKAAIADEVHRDVWPHVEDGEIEPVIHEVFDLQAASDAHALMESSAHIGKIMLKVR